MATSKHTPGPWETRGCIIESTKFIVATAEIQPPSSAEAVANARLIAAAPQLLEALIAVTDEAEAALRETWGDGPSSDLLEDMPVFLRARAAIKAATQPKEN